MPEQRQWTQKEVDKLLALKDTLGPSAIGKELGRSRDSIRHKLRTMGVESLHKVYPPKPTRKIKEKPVEARQPKKKRYIAEECTIDWCRSCGSPVSDWVGHRERMGCRRTA